MLAFMCGNKVLSPQHVLWVLPLVALCLAARHPSHRAVGVLMLAAIALTQVEFPGLYSGVVALESVPLLVIVARNILLLAAFVLVVVSLWGLPPTRQREVRGPALRSS